MVFEWPQIIYTILLFLNVCIYVGKHGEEKTGKYNAGTGLFCSGVVFFLLYQGGFYG